MAALILQDMVTAVLEVVSLVMSSSLAEVMETLVVVIVGLLVVFFLVVTLCGQKKRGGGNEEFLVTGVESLLAGFLKELAGWQGYLLLQAPLSVG